MKRPAISLLVCVALVGWAATSHAKKGGGKAAAPAAGSDSGGDDSGSAKGGDAPAGDQAGAADDKSAGSKEAAPSESLEGDETQPGKVEEDVGGGKAAARPTSTLSWNDIVVVPRKAFIKSGRLQLKPFTGITVNDNLIRHYVFGGDIDYFLSDALWVGLQGLYYIKQLTNEEELLGSEYNRAPTLNEYKYAGSLHFGYVPIYGKFALFNRSIISWEIWASLGVGATFTQVIPRDPANASLAFKNTDITVSPALGSQFFLTDWLTVHFALTDYIMPDKFEPKPDNTTLYPTAAAAKAGAQSAFVNNLVFSIGVGFYLPTKFQYKSPR